jgi:hypothetical protein
VSLDFDFTDGSFFILDANAHSHVAAAPVPEPANGC